MRFRDRVDAGRRLAAALREFAAPDVVVLGLPRGGVPVAAPVAHALQAPLDVLVVRKLGAPGQPELAMGAVGEDAARVIDDRIVRSVRATPEQLAAIESRERAAVEQRVELFRAGRRAVPLAGRTAIVVDDGIATGATMRAACMVARARGAARVVAAVPVSAGAAWARLAGAADDAVALLSPSPFGGVGRWYEDFSPTSDDEVRRLLA